VLSMEPRTHESDEAPSLARQLAELASRPAGDTRLERLRGKAIELARRATTWGPFEPMAEVGWRTLRRDASIGGSVLGAALAYRIFIWLLPFALVIVLALALFAGRTDGNIAELVSDAGLTGFVATSVADAADGTSGWAIASGLVVALVVLLYQTSTLLRAIRAITALAWGLPVTRVPSPTRSGLLFLGWLVAFLVVAGSAAPIRHALDFPVDLIVDLAMYSAGLPLLWLLLSWFLLPHRSDRWLELIPGALLVGFGVGAIGLFNTLVLFPWLAGRQETYGVLGVAAGLLFGFFLIGRTMELSASLNATLADERRRRVAP
jgi:membrane protein